ncbi:hypothetical protein AAC387_Pa06g0956 [Persea americana]
MGYWKSKLLPKIKKVFETKSPKKTAAAEACKSFDASKEAISKEFEAKKTELQSKVVEIYEASSNEIKTVVKERNESGIKKNSVEVHKFLEELVKIDFPGSNQVFEASTKFGPTMVRDPIFFVFEKVSTFVITEEMKVEGKEEETGKEVEKAKEVVVKEEKEEEEKKEKDEVEKVVVEATTEKPEPATESTQMEATKVEEEEKRP